MREEDLGELMGFLGASRGLEDPVAIGLQFEAELRQFSLGPFALHMIVPARDRSSPFSGLWNFPSAWIAHYERSAYLAIDPVAAACRQARRPFNWFGVLARGDLDKRQRQLFLEAAEFGIGLGLTVPVREGDGRVSMISLTTDFANDPTADAIRVHAPLLCLLGLALYDRTAHLAQGRHVELGNDITPAASPRATPAEPAPAASVTPLLSRLERDCLAWKAAGLDPWEVSDRLCIAADDIVRLIESARTKLSASSPEHAIVRALDLGILRL